MLAKTVLQSVFRIGTVIAAIFDILVAETMTGRIHTPMTLLRHRVNLLPLVQETSLFLLAL